MTAIFATILALFIAAYGFLLVLGGGPRYANKLPRAVGRAAGDALCGILRGLFGFLGAVLTSLVRFVFDRPRR
jgi:hypothetical protein